MDLDPKNRAEVYYDRILKQLDDISNGTSDSESGSEGLNPVNRAEMYYKMILDKIDEIADGGSGGDIDPAVIEQAVSDWLTAHPEATTTVTDGSITYNKLDINLKGKVDAVSSLSDEIDDMGSDVTDLKSALSDSELVHFHFLANNFVVGGRGEYSEYGINPSTTTRITNKAGYYISFPVTVNFKPDVSIKYYIYFSDGSVTGWRNNEYTLSKDTLCSVVVAYVDDRTVTDVGALLDLLVLKNPLQQYIEGVPEKVNELLFYPNMIPYKTGYNYGYISNDGSISGSFGNAAIYYKDYVPVEVGTEYLLETDFITEAMGMSWYDSDKQFISRNNYYPPTNKQKIVVEAPSGASYLRVALLYSADITDAFLSTHKIVVTDERYANVGVDSFDDGGSSTEEETQTEFYGKKISILGDSISTFTGYSYPGNRCRYPQSNLLTDVNDTYWMRLINDLGMVLGISETWAGSRVSNTSETDTGDVGPNRCISSATRIGHLGENGTPDIIMVNAGTNDIGASVTIGTFNTESPMDYTDEQIAALPVATFADAYRTMLIRLQKSYPTSMIICLLPNYTTSYYTPTKADQYCEIIKEACDYFGVKWYDMRTCGVTIFNRATYLPDGIHPNAVGMALMFKELRKDFVYDLTTY